MNPDDHTSDVGGDGQPVADPIVDESAQQPALPHVQPAQPTPVVQPAADAGAVAATPPAPQPTAGQQNPASAEDVDLIEKAWVEKAKEIVHNTQGDPYTQSKEINRVKADYIKKRYSRDVQVDE